MFRIAFERRGSFYQNRESARPWLYGIATNLIARHRRSEGRRLRAMALLASTQVDSHDDLVGDRVSETIDADEAWDQLAEIVDELPVVAGRVGLGCLRFWRGVGSRQWASYVAPVASGSGGHEEPRS